MKLSAYLNKTKQISIAFEGETLNVDYKPHVVTPVFLDSLEGLDNRKSINKQLCAAVQKWDLEGEDGKILPITEETLQELPTEFSAILLQRIVDDMQAPGKDEKKTEALASYRR